MADIVPYKRPQAQLQTRHQTFRRGAWQSGNVYWSKSQSQSSNIASKVLSGLQQAAGTSGGGGIFTRSISAIRPGSIVAGSLRRASTALQNFGSGASFRSSQRQGLFQRAGSAASTAFSGSKYGLSKTAYQALRGRASIRGALREGVQQYIRSVNPRAARLAELRQQRSKVQSAREKKRQAAELKRKQAVLKESKKLKDLAYKTSAQEQSRIQKERNAKAKEGKKLRDLTYKTVANREASIKKDRDLAYKTMAQSGGRLPTRTEARFLASQDAARREASETQARRQASIQAAEAASQQKPTTNWSQLSKAGITPFTRFKPVEPGRQTPLRETKEATARLRQGTQKSYESLFGQGGKMDERERLRQQNREIRDIRKSPGAGLAPSGATNQLKRNPEYKPGSAKPEFVPEGSKSRMKEAARLRAERNLPSKILDINKQQRKFAKLTGTNVTQTQIKKNPLYQKGSSDKQSKYVQANSPERMKKSLELRSKRLQDSGQTVPEKRSSALPAGPKYKLSGKTAPGELFKVKNGQVLRVSAVATEAGSKAGVGVSAEKSLNASLKQSNTYILQKRQESLAATGSKGVSSKREGRKRAGIAGKEQKLKVGTSLSKAKQELKEKRKLLFEGVKAGTPEYYRRYYQEIKRSKLISSGKMKGKRKNKPK